jgi:hypothetical protein
MTALLQGKQVLSRLAGMVNTYDGMIQPKQCDFLAPDELSVGGPISWHESPDSFQLGLTPDPSGTLPPAVTYSGTLALAKGAWVKILTTGARGTAQFRTYLDGLGVTPVEASNQTTAATYVIPGTSLTVNFPVGAYTNDNVYKGVGNPVNDKTANLYHLVNTTGGTRPYVITVGPLGGLPIWRFDGANDRQIGPSAMATAVCGGTDNPFMVTALVNVNAVPTGAATACIFTASHTTDADIPLCELRMTSTAWQLNRRATAANSKFATSAIIPSTGGHLLIWGFDGSSSFLRDNGVYVIGGDSGVAGTGMALAAATTFNQFCVGMRSISGGLDEPCSMDLVSLVTHTAPPATLAELEMYESYFLQ